MGTHWHVAMILSSELMEEHHIYSGAYRSTARQLIIYPNSTVTKYGGNLPNITVKVKNAKGSGFFNGIFVVLECFFIALLCSSWDGPTCKIKIVLAHENNVIYGSSRGAVTSISLSGV